MNEDNIKPTTAYDLLTPQERESVDSYMNYIINKQRQRRERIALALNHVIPNEFIKRSRGALAKPVPRAALAERIQQEADKQDLNPSRVIEEYRRIAYSSELDFLEVGAFNELRLKPLEEIPEEKWAAVKAIRISPSMTGTKVELTMYDKLAALDKFTKLMGMVAPDKPPVLEDYVTDKNEAIEMMQTAEDVYAAMIEGN